MDQSQILTVLASMGGTAAIFALLGRIFADRILESQKIHYARELEALRSSLELSRVQEQNRAEARFKLYSEVWARLVDVKSAADLLWEHASRENFEPFVNSLREARIAANRGRLILLEMHFRRLEKLLKTFEEFRLGKQRLIELRSRRALIELYQYSSQAEIQQQIRRNGDSKGAYEELLLDILSEFKNQLGLVSQVSAGGRGFI